MKNALIIFFLLLIGFSKSIFAELTLYPKDFLNFSICSFASSLGQICKNNPDFLFSDFKDSKIEIIDEKLLIETNDWYYSFEIIDRKENEIIVEFIDDGKIGTYLAVSHYKINFDNNSHEWKIIGEKIILPEEEKTENYKIFEESIVFDKIDLLTLSLLSNIENNYKCESSNDNHIFEIYYDKFSGDAIVQETTYESENGLMHGVPSYCEKYRYYCQCGMTWCLSHVHPWKFEFNNSNFTYKLFYMFEQLKQENIDDYEWTLLEEGICNKIEK